MSRKGRKPIQIKPDVDITMDNQLVRVKGGKGELVCKVREGITIEREGDRLVVTSRATDKQANAYYGLYRSLIANMVEGVTDGFKKELELFVVGYRAQKQGNGLKLTLGYSHPVSVAEIEGIQFELISQTEITVSGIDKEKVGQVAANIIKLRDARKDPYKGKGIKYKGTVLIKKAGKKVK